MNQQRPFPGQNWGAKDSEHKWDEYDQIKPPAYSIDSTEPQVAETSGQNPRVFGHENDRKHNLEAQVESLEYPDQTKSNQTKSNLKGKSVNE